jgi:proteasome lid subunit RPN8/RPN11
VPGGGGPAPPRGRAPLLASPGMRISRDLYDEMVTHARADAPNECCGMIASRDGEAVRLYRAENAAASPLRYEIDGPEQYRIQMAIDDEDLDLGAIYHSHTRSAPYPSQTDINLAFYPDALYVIVGLAGDAPEVKAYEIRDGRVADAELSVT